MRFIAVVKTIFYDFSKVTNCILLVIILDKISKKRGEGGCVNGKVDGVVLCCYCILLCILMDCVFDHLIILYRPKERAY